MSGAGETLLTVEDLVIRFRRRGGWGGAASGASSHLTAVDRVSFTVGSGEVLGLVGESGSGKTTIGKAIMRLYRPSSGRLRFAGTEIATLSERALRPLRPKMQMVFQDPLSSLNPRHSIRTTLGTPLWIHGACPRASLDDKIEQALARVGLPPSFKNRFPHEMSGGQLQRVAIARALLLSPSLVVADEPVSKLDVSVRAKILNLFKEIQAETGIALVFITHDLRVARYLCDRIGVMYFGKLVELAPTRDIFARPRHPYTKALLGTVTETASFLRLAGEAPAMDSSGCRYYQRCPIRRERCLSAHPPLEALENGHMVACYEAEAAS